MHEAGVLCTQLDIAQVYHFYVHVLWCTQISTTIGCNQMMMIMQVVNITLFPSEAIHQRHL